jgi:hypothetical protein
MIRFLFRFLGVLILAAAFILLVYDGAKSIADSRVYIYKLGQLWTDISASSLESLKASAETHLPIQVWDPVALTLLEQPAWLVLGVTGILFILIGRKRKPLIGYGRD